MRAKDRNLKTAAAAARYNKINQMLTRGKESGLTRIPMCIVLVDRGFALRK
jgi:hypothetical protein